MGRWSKLQKRLYLIIDQNINFQIHCTVYRMQSQRGSVGLPRYFITLNKEILFDYPKQFVNQEVPDQSLRGSLPENITQKVGMLYPYCTEISDISELIVQYIDTPINELYEKQFENDRCGLTDILKSADRRIGLRRLKSFTAKNNNDAVIKIISARQSKCEL